MTSNPTTGRLRWLMLLVMVADFTLTLVGQPSSYWKDPSTAQEFNSLARAAMHQGPLRIAVGWSVYAATAFVLATFLPGRFAAIAAITFTLAHLTAASSWLMYRFHLGMTGLYLASFAVAAALVLLRSEGEKG